MTKVRDMQGVYILWLALCGASLNLTHKAHYDKAF